MAIRVALVLSLFVCSLFGAVPAPKDHFGFVPGDDYKLADYQQISSYFQKLAKSSDRMKLVEFGKTSEGRPMYVAFISSPQNLKKLDYYRGLNRSLALALVEPEQARKMAAEAKAIVWIDSGLHATEVAPAQHAPILAYQLLTSTDPKVRRMLDNVILVQIPVINPDGLELVAHWYMKNVGTPHELSMPPALYQKYSGHDNNRDWFMMNLQETRNVTKLLYQDWFPQIIYNQHQQPAFPARIFVPPYSEPMNPNIPPSVMQGINMLGAAITERLSMEGKAGALSYTGFDGWWNGGMRSGPAFHNMHGILTETASAGLASPREYSAAKFPARFSNGMPTKEPSIFYPYPWMGGKWTLRDATEYMLTADYAILELASARREEFVWKAYQLAKRNRESQAAPYAYVISPEQWDRSAAPEMVRRLAMAGVEVKRAKSAFEAGGKRYPQGTLVMLAAQPFRGYLMDLMEPQKYPEIRVGTTGPTKRPYDIAGWTLRMSMGANVDRVDTAFTASLEDAGEIGVPAPALDHRDNSSFVATIDMLRKGVKVRWAADGKILVEGAATADEFNKGAWQLNTPKLALYEPYTANIDTGWVQWTLDNHKVPHTLLHNADVRKGALRERFDTIILASQAATSIVNGSRRGTASPSYPDAPGAQQREEYTGGIGAEGVENLKRFVEQGGTLIALDSAAELPVQRFGLGVKGLVRGAAPSEGGGDREEDNTGYYCPGSLLRLNVDNTNPLAFGMPKEVAAFVMGGQAWDVSDTTIQAFAHYAGSNLLASGWISGEKIVLGKSIALEARLGKGRIVLYGFRPHFRGQTFATFKLLLNAIYLGSATKL